MNSYGTRYVFKMGQTRPLLVYFRSFHMTNIVQINDKSYGVLGTQTQGGRMVGADESTELWRLPCKPFCHSKKASRIGKFVIHHLHITLYSFGNLIKLN